MCRYFITILNNSNNICRILSNLSLKFTLWSNKIGRFMENIPKYVGLEQVTWSDCTSMESSKNQFVLSGWRDHTWVDNQSADFSVRKRRFSDSLLVRVTRYDFSIRGEIWSHMRRMLLLIVPYKSDLTYCICFWSSAPEQKIILKISREKLADAI